MEPGRYVGVLAFHEERVVLVREHRDNWGGTFWNIPSGRVESGETPVDAAVRELREETGVVVSPDRLTPIASVSVGHHDDSSAQNFETDVDDDELRVDDPDASIQEARWFDRDAAVAELRRLPYRPLAEPAIAHLTGVSTVGCHWSFPDPTADPVLTTGRLLTDARAALRREQRQLVGRLADLTGDHDAMVAASRDTNADDEHDPEGATIAFERSQLDAVVLLTRTHLADVERALVRLADGTYGVCAGCGRPIDPARLSARPAADRCLACAASR